MIISDIFIEKSRERRSSAGDMLDDSPRLQKKKFTQSTTALNLLNGEQKSAGFSLRGNNSDKVLKTGKKLILGPNRNV